MQIWNATGKNGCLG